MRTTVTAVCTLALAACSTTGGQIMPDGQSDIPAGKAVIAFSTQVTDGTTYDNCSVFVGRSAATAQWFAWSVQGDRVTIVALVVEPGEYGFHRFGCTYRALPLSTGVAGPQLTVDAGDSLYLGRLQVGDTGMGTAAGYSRMPTSTKLDFVDRRDEDLEALAARWPVFTSRPPVTDIPASWGGYPRYQLRPYRQNAEIVVAPVL